MYNVKLKISLGMAMCFIALPAFAESAPVYDADDIQQQLDNAVDTDQDLPPPPAPGQENNAFVPAPPASPSSASSASQSTGASVMNSSTGMSLDQRVRRVEQQVNSINA